ncbi:30S ribosomal protein S2 [Mycoplasma procyoni]|uniref:30S ribosomal protein S2 n=1 Tax=Mycoplasma procyoni TaxID=568784 RepID=UPI00197B16E8|nr:30S ribosomal protein S2 [Mycoplasma procyoni]MBN3534750.1 30S ribosomal protein S2 [Mycoplasma procyoni]
MENTQKEKHLDREVVSKQKLLEAGTYFGHKAAQWNPKMKPYIYTKKMGTHIIDTQKTQKSLLFAYNLIFKFAENNAKFIFVGTKRQAKKAVEEQALRTNSAYVSERWLGGTLTNHRTISNSIRKMEDLEVLAKNNFEGYTKKEGVLKAKELQKLQKNLNGIRNMQGLPSVMIIADPKNDIIAVQEARKKGLKVIGIIDTDTDPNLVDFAIPANDDSTKSITLILTILADAIVVAKGGKALFAYQEDDKIVLPEDPVKERREFNGQRRFANRENAQENKKEENK